MGWLPAPVEQLLDVALVGELTVVGRNGRPITHPLIPLHHDGLIYLHSSTLFSKKLEHIKRDPHVVAGDHRSDRHEGQSGPRHDPGHGEADRGRSAFGLGAADPRPVAPQGAADRRLPEGPRRAPALLRAIGDRDHAGALPVLGRRTDRCAARRDPEHRRRRPRDGRSRRRADRDALGHRLRPRRDRRGPAPAGRVPACRRQLGRRRRLPDERRHDPRCRSGGRLRASCRARRACRSPPTAR